MTDGHNTPVPDITGLIERLGRGRVLCIGDLMLDRFVEGVVERISPEAPIPILAASRERNGLGGVGNVARNLDALGVPATLIACVGSDSAAQEVRDALSSLELVFPTLIEDSTRPTTVKIRYVSGMQQLLRVDHEVVGKFEDAVEERLLSAAEQAMDATDVVVLSDYGKGVLSPRVVKAVIEMAERRGLPVIVDPKGRDYSIYRGASFVTPNRAELSLATGLPVRGDEAVIAAALRIVEGCGVSGVLATRSEEGMSVVIGGADGTPRTFHLKARAREVFDVAGAGDTVVAGLAAGLAAGMTVMEAATLANLAAGIVVGKVGTAVAYPDEILAAEHGNQWHNAEAKVVPVAAARDRVDAWRRQGLKVGFTNGCFDLLHPGHISLIAQARATCDRLVVGLNSDASVKRLKGETRPVMNETSRATVLSSLANVDLVVVFGEDTPLDLIRELNPDVLIKGADYTVETVVGSDLVLERGGRVVLADLLEGQSTTATIGRLKS